MTAFSIAVFGLAGVFARYYLGAFITRLAPHPFPYGVFAINILGSFAIGVVYVLGLEKEFMSEEIRIGIIVGFLGGFTTFSSYCLDAGRLLEEGDYVSALLYWGLSPILGLLATFLGFFLTRAFVKGGV